MYTYVVILSSVTLAFQFSSAECVASPGYIQECVIKGKTFFLCIEMMTYRQNTLKKPFQRAAQWDGISPNGRDHALTPQDFREMIAYVQERRGNTTPFDVLMVGRTTGSDKERDRAMVSAFAEAGVTWWQEGLNWNHSLEQVHRRIQQGPPRV